MKLAPTLCQGKKVQPKSFYIFLLSILTGNCINLEHFEISGKKKKLALDCITKRKNGAPLLAESPKKKLKKMQKMKTKTGQASADRGFIPISITGY